MNSSPTQALTLPVFYQAQIDCLLAHQQAIEAELAKRNLQDLPIEKLFRLSDLINHQLQHAHGYNAFRQHNRCCKCDRELPPLDPKSRTPWLPPARPAPAATTG